MRESNAITRIADLKRSLEEIKTRQPTGSDQIVFEVTENSGNYDWSGAIMINPQAVVDAVIVTVESPDLNLIAQTNIKLSTSPNSGYKTFEEIYDQGISSQVTPNGGELSSYIEINETSKYSKIFYLNARTTDMGQTGNYVTVYVKAQAVTNAKAVTLKVETFNFWED